jgi:ABC-type branched-subunit amino acid transport system permease subunit
MTTLADSPTARPRLAPWGLGLAGLAALLAVPLYASPYVIEAILLPFLALSLAGLGLNLLTGYGGQVSLGSAAFMAVGAFAAYNFQLRLGLGLPVSILLAAFTAAAIGLATRRHNISCVKRAWTAMFCLTTLSCASQSKAWLTRCRHPHEPGRRSSRHSMSGNPNPARDLPTSAKCWR